MEVAATSTLELSAQRLRAGIDFERVPFQGTLVATGIDPSFLSGLSPQITSLGGRIHADLHVAGSYENPDLRGEFRWEQGEAEVAGYGSYSNVQLVARGDRNRVVIENLSVSSAGGTGSVTGTLQRDGGAGYALDAPIRTDHLPITIRGPARGDGDPERQRPGSAQSGPGGDLPVRGDARTHRTAVDAAQGRPVAGAAQERCLPPQWTTGRSGRGGRGGAPGPREKPRRSAE